MNKISSIIWGLALITVGVIMVGNALEWFDINLFFKGWWTLFIIVPCTISLITEKGKMGSLIGIILGVLLLLACQDVIGFESLWKVFLPIIVIIIGVTLIGKSLFSRKFDEVTEKLNKKINKDDGTGAVFGGQDINMAGKEFKGKNINAVFGAMKLDLRKAIIKEDVMINASAVFGGIEIIVPEDVAVETKSNSIFGGVSNKKDSAPKKGAPTVYVNGMALFGGIEIKD